MAAEVIEFVLHMRDGASRAVAKTRQEVEKTDAVVGNTQRSFAAGAASAAHYATAALGVAAAASAAATGLVKIADAASRLVDQYVILGKQTGLLTDQVVALDFAAKAAGVSGAQELQSGLAALVRTANDAADGSAEAAAKFAKLGLAPEDLRIDDTDALLRQFADALATLPSESARAASGIEILGNRGAKLIAVLDGGASSLDEWATATRAAGLAMDEAALTASADMDRAMAQLDLTTKAVTLGIGKALTPAVLEATTSLLQATPAIIDLTTGAIELVQTLNRLSPSMAILRGLGALSQTVADGYDRLYGRSTVLAEAHAGAAEQTQGLAGSLDAAAESADKLTVSMNLDAAEKFVALQEEAMMRATGASAAQIKLFQSLEAVDATTQAYIATLDREADSYDALVGAALRTAEVIKAQRREEAAAAGARQKGAQATAEAAEALTPYQEALRAAREELEAMTGPLDGADRALDSQAERWVHLNEAIGAALSPLDDLLLLQTDLVRAFDQGAISAEQFARGLDFVDAQRASLSQGGGGFSQAEADGMAVEISSASIGALGSAVTAGLGGLTDPAGLTDMLATGIGAAVGGPIGAAIGSMVSDVLGALADIGKMSPEEISALVEGFTGAIIAGVEALPTLIAELIPELVTSLALEVVPALVMAIDDIVFAIIRLPFEIIGSLARGLAQWWESIGGLKGIAIAVWEGVTSWFSKVWQNIKDFFRDLFKLDRDGDGKGPVKELVGFFQDAAEFVIAGDTSRDHYPKGGFVTRDGLAYVEAGERIVRRSGHDSHTGHAATPAPGASSVSGGAPFILQAGFVDAEILPRLEERLDRMFGAEGNRTSPLFAGA